LDVSGDGPDPFLVAGFDAVELSPPQPAPRWKGVETGDELDRVLGLQQLGDPGAQLTSHSRDQDAHHLGSGRRVGNRITSRMLRASVNSIAKRSMPIPSPPVGGMPYSRARRKSSSTTMASSSPPALRRACSSR